MTITNETKLQGLSANVFFPTLLIFLYFEQAYFVIAIYLFFIIWYFVKEISVYSALLKTNVNAKSYVVTIIVLILINGSLALLTKLSDNETYKYICIFFLLYSAWFAYFEAQKYYLKNKTLLDEHLSNE